jgi:hypothetical protein
MLAASMNAMLTWWGVCLALLNHDTLGNAVINHQTLLKVVPVFVAIMVWLIRVLIIGSFSVAGDKLFHQVGTRSSTQRQAIGRPQLNQGRMTPVQQSRPATTLSSATSSFRPAPKISSQADAGYAKQEPSYHPVSVSAQPASNDPHVRR